MQGDTVTLQEVFRFKEEGFDKNRKIVGQFQALGLIPTFIEDFEQRGVVVPRDLFITSTPSGVKKDAKPIGPSRPNIPRTLPTPTPPKKTGTGGSS
jgi:septum site-determining protein MinD